MTDCAKRVDDSLLQWSEQQWNAILSYNMVGKAVATHLTNMAVDTRHSHLTFTKYHYALLTNNTYTYIHENKT